MGIRTTQYFGLNEWARALINDNRVPKYTDHIVRKHVNGKEERLETTIAGIPETTIGNTHGMFDEEIPLNEYTLKDGQKVREFVQADPWSSGPCIFIALKNEAGLELSESKWTDEEIRNC